MGKLWVFLLLAIVAVTYALDADYDSNEASNQDYYNYDNWYDDILNLRSIGDEVKKDSGEEVLDDGDKNEKFVDTDYQIEDNRSALTEEKSVKQETDDSKVGEDERVNDYKELKEAAASSFEEEEAGDEDKEPLNEDAVLEIVKVDSKENQEAQDDDFDNAQSQEIAFGVNDDIEPLPLPPEGDVNEEIEKTRRDSEQVSVENSDNDFAADNLDANDNDNQNNNEDIESKVDIELTKQDLEDIFDKDSVDAAYKDLNEDLDKLMETWKKLSLDAVEEEKDPDDSITSDDILDYEEKYGRPYKEGIVLSQREGDYDDVNVDLKSDNEETIADEKDVKSSVEVERDNNSEQSELKNAAEENSDNADVILGKEENEDAIDSAEDSFSDSEEVDAENQNGDDTIKSDEEDGDEAEDTVFKDAAEESDDVNNRNAKYTEVQNDERDAKETEAIETKNAEKTNKDLTVDAKVEVQNRNSEKVPYLPPQEMHMPPKDESTRNSENSLDVSEINHEQYDELMTQFRILHFEELYPKSDASDNNVAVIHVPIYLDHAVVVESPNYPNPYEANNIIEWIFEGDGIGVELNITDLAVNGVNGDYLLVKPGGVDESGTNGLVFSYHLNQPRRYRFLEVNKIFVRFVAQPGWTLPTTRGFQFSVKLVAPPLTEEEPLPEPEPELPEPVDTLTLVLGGIPKPLFHQVEEEFRTIIADMATMYINSNGIDPGMNTTLEVTQITSVAICNINWPNFENCTQVTFAVPLVNDYVDEDDEPMLSTAQLTAMWNQYYGQDPFAARLRRMGLAEFASPNDNGVLAVWLVVSAGVLVIMAIMAFALWRYSCYDTYSRMPEFSSRDSLYKEKGGLDLYPTPHQTLPPLYESEYWADGNFQDSARVDMSGYTNRNFTRDELFDIESDEDAISTRDRKIVIASEA